MSGPARLTIGTNSPWDINGERGIANGWTKTVCVQCTNGDQTIEHKNFVVTQNIDCGVALSSQPTAPTNPVLTFDSGTPTTNVAKWDSFFVNSDMTNCGTNSCVLKESGCLNPYTKTNL
jgi:hypothetical protein